MHTCVHAAMHLLAGKDEITLPTAYGKTTAMITLEEMKSALAKVGIKPTEVGRDTLKAQTNLLDIEAKQSAAGLRFECQILHSVPRNKIFLWNIIHHNNACFPFGSFYISPENKICFGFFLPKGNYFESWLDRVVFECISTAEGYYKIIQSEFNELPFDEEQLSLNLLDLIRTELKPPKHTAPQTRQEGMRLLERILEEVVGLENMVRTNEFEYSITQDQIVQISLEKTPFYRKGQDTSDWYICLRSEVGMLSSTDSKLYVQFNRFNYEGFLVAHGIQYRERKPLVTLSSALLPDFIQHPGVVRLALQQHGEQAGQLLSLLNKPYRIQSMVDYKLGF